MQDSGRLQIKEHKGLCFRVRVSIRFAITSKFMISYAALPSRCKMKIAMYVYKPGACVRRLT